MRISLFAIFNSLFSNELLGTDDGLLLANGNKDVSPVALINGVGAEAFVEELSNSAGFQDPDARYNSLITNVPNGLLGGDSTNFGTFGEYATFPGVHEFNMTFANGTQASFPLRGQVRSSVGNFTFTTGEELFQAVCAQTNTTGSSSKKLKRDEDMAELSKRQEDTKPLAAPSGFPTPIVRDPFNLVVGYFPEDAALKDVAVMTVGSFGSGEISDAEITTFAVKAQEFVEKSVAASKSKIILDLTQNPGGTVVSGFALLSIFFPNMTIFSSTRIRSVPETQYIFETGSRVTDADLKAQFDSQGLLISTLVQPDQTTGFKSTSDFLGPFDELNVPSTATSAENNFRLNNGTDTPINIFGTGGVLNGTAPPYKPEDIIIVSSLCLLVPFICFYSANTLRQLTDGQCSSTCTVFINHMIPYGVRVVANGGRPQVGPMQGIGGVKGAQVLDLATISQFYQFTNQVVQNATEAKKPLFTSKELDAFKDHIPVLFEELPLKISTATVNYRNAFAPFNDEQPTHFIYQPANCRLFYTPASLLKPDANWANVANAIWGKGECAFSIAPPPPLLSDEPTSTSSSKPAATTAAGKATAAGKKKTQSSAHKAVGLLLAMAEGLKPQ